MLMKTIDAHNPQTTLKELLSLVESGTEVVFVEGNTPIARLVSVSERIAGLHTGAIWTSKDFDEPLLVNRNQEDNHV